MNVDAEIVLQESRDTLAIPNAAVNRGNTVLITADSPSAVNALDQEAPEGYVYVQVETGISDDSYIQVMAGLREGDTVAYIQTSSGSGARTWAPWTKMSWRKSATKCWASSSSNTTCCPS